MAKGINKVISHREAIMAECEMYVGGMSIPEVSESTGTPLSTLRFRFKKAGVLRSRSDAIRLSASQGKLGSGLRGKTREFTQEWKDNISKSKAGRGKGIALKPSGYIAITMGPNKDRSQHSVIMEEVIGRRILPGECVHHINGVRSDNRVENLQLMTRTEHSRLHALENARKRAKDSRGRFA